MKPTKTLVWFLLVCSILSFPFITAAQQFKWSQNNGAGAVLGSNLYLSPTTNATTSNGVAINETYVSFSNNINHLLGAGAGTSPDIGLVESNSSKLVRYDANMNLVWIGYANGIIAADPKANDQFYLAFTSTAVSSTFGGFAITGQAAATAGYLAKCKATGSQGFSVLWVVKIDGSSDELFAQLQVKDIGGNNVRIAVSGVTRSPNISNYANGTTGLAQTTPVNGGGGALYDYFISEYNDDGTTATPLWINTFGNSAFSESGAMPMDINDDGDILFAAVYSGNSLGTSNYTLNNSSGTTPPGTVITTSYSASITNSRYLLFRFDRGTGVPTVVHNEFAAVSNFVPQALATDAARNIYMYGLLTGTYTLAGGVTITSAGSADVAVVVLDNAGTPLRSQRYGGTGDERASGVWPNSFALDRTNSRLYITGRCNSAAGFTAGTASVQYTNGFSGFLLATEATGTMSGLSAVTILGSISGSTQEFRAVVARPDGKVLGAQQYSGSGYNRLNSNSTNLLPKTAFGYTDVALTRFNGTAANLLNPELESTAGASTGNTINGSAIKGNKLLMGGLYSGNMTVGSTTISGAGAILIESDTAVGTINLVKAITGSGITTADIRINPVDGSVYICGSTSSDLNPGTALNKSLMGNRDAFIMKLDSAYNHQWTAFIGGAEADFISGFTVDPLSGDVYVTGPFNSPSLYLNAAGATTYGSSVIAANSNASLPISTDVFVAKFNTNGVMQWIKAGGSSSNVINDNIYKGIAYQNGGLYVGCVTPTNSTFTWGTSSLSTTSTGSGSSTDMVLMKLDLSSGLALWMKTWGGNNTDIIASLASGNGKIYVGGYSNSSSGMSFGGTAFSTSNNNDAFIFAVDASGTEQAAFMQLKGSSSDIINEIKTDAIGNIFFAGSSNSINLPVAGSVLSTAGNSDLLIGSVDPESMSPKFGFMTGSVQTESANTVMPGSVGMAFIGGNLLGTATFGTQVLNGRLGGDFVYARIDYPFLAPGAQASNLNAWFKSNALLSGNPAATWTNSSANSSLTTLISSGTVPVNAAGANFNPSLSITGGTNYVSQSGIYASNFLDASGIKYAIYAVYKPSGSSDRLSLWSETVTNTGVNLAVGTSSVTGTGGTKSITKTSGLPLTQYSLDALVVNGGSISSFLNGKSNGTQSGATAVSTINAGAFQFNGTGNMEVAEVAVYGGAHTSGQPTMNQIDTYFALKYGISLSHHYYSTTGDTLFGVDGAGAAYLYDNNIAGIGIDSNEMLVQKQGRSQNVASKGNMLTIGLGAIAANNAVNTATPGNGLSYLVWGDDAASVTTTQSADMSLTVSSCAYRFPREWKIFRTGSGIGTTQVQLDLSNTIPLGNYTTSDFQLMIDQDGDGDFTTGQPALVNAADFTANTVTFNNVVWDADSNGSDVFTLLINNKLPPVALVPGASSRTALNYICTDVAGTLIFVNDITTPTEKYLAIYPNSNTGYSFNATAVNNFPAINNHRVTNGISATSALSNRMYTINDAGTDNYPSGMKVRLYYTVADSTAAVAALDTSVNGLLTYRWFKKTNASPADVLAAQTANSITGADWLLPSAYGKENGIRYVEFSGLNSFSTFGAVAVRINWALPLKLNSFTGKTDHCKAILTWKTSQEQNLQYFEIQYSADGLAYKPVNKQAAVNIIQGGSYSVSIQQPSVTGFYRLRMVDKDSSSSYSQVVTLASVACSTGSWLVSPNPVKQGMPLKVDIGGFSGTGLQAMLTNLQGQQIWHKIIPPSSGPAFAIPTRQLATGTYFLRLQDAGGHIVGEVQKVVVQ